MKNTDKEKYFVGSKLSNSENLQCTQVAKETKLISSPISRPTSLEGAVGSSTYEELLAETRRQEAVRSGKPRMVVLDGMNVGMAHGLGSFSVTGLSYAYEYFRERGNPVRIFLPRRMWGKASEEDRHSLDALQTTGILFYVQNHAYDDLFIIKYASNNEGIILSNDLYRDVLQTHPDTVTQKWGVSGQFRF